MTLDRDRAAFERERPRLLAEGQSGRHALVKGDEVDSLWDTRNDALQAGYRLFGLDSFLVCAVEAEETVHVIPRLLAPQIACHTSPRPSLPKER